MQLFLCTALLSIVVTCDSLAHPFLKKSGPLEVNETIRISKGFKAHLYCPTLRSGQQEFEKVIWIFHSVNELVGSGIQYNYIKYQYLPSTGQLIIRNVSYEDAGIYRCLTQLRYESGSGPRNGRKLWDTSSVELKVVQSYHDIWNEEFETNLVRALVASTAFFSSIAIVCVVYSCRWISRSHEPYGAGRNAISADETRSDGNNISMSVGNGRNKKVDSFAYPPSTIKIHVSTIEDETSSQEGERGNSIGLSPTIQPVTHI